MGSGNIKDVKTNLANLAEKTLIGIGLTVRGDLTSIDNISVCGVVEGNIKAPEHVVTIRKEGQVKGHVFGRKIVVEGRMRGNLYAEEIVILKPSADVLGKIFSSRVSLEDGGRYKGRINMDAKSRRVAMARTKPTNSR